MRANFELWRQMWGTGLQDNGITSNRLSNKKLSWTIDKYIGSHIIAYADLKFNSKF